MAYTYELDTSLLPQVWLTWTSTKGGKFDKRYWLNCQTCEKKDTPEDWMSYDGEDSLHRWYSSGDKTPYNRFSFTFNKVWTYAGSHIIYFYAKYHEDIEKLEVAAVTMDTRRTAESHPWKWAGQRYFIGKDKSVVDIEGNIPTGYRLYEYHSAPNMKGALGILGRLSFYTKAIDEFKKFIGAESFLIGNGTAIDATNSWHIQRWYTTSQKARGKGKEQKLTDELTAIPLTDISGFATKYPIKTLIVNDSTWRSKEEIKDIIYFERVNEDWSVLRMLHRNYDNTILEAWRLYIGDDGRNRITMPSKSGNWIATRQPSMSWNFNYYLVNKDQAMSDCPRCKYILSALPADTHPKKMAKTLITALRFPEIEQLIKFGHIKLADYFIGSNTFKADMRNLFGVYNEKETNICRKINLTKKQLDAFAKLKENDNGYGWYASDGLKMMRLTYGDKITAVDPSAFEEQLFGNALIRRYFYNNVDRLSNCYGVDTQKFIKNIIRLGKKSESAYRQASDTVSLFFRLRAGTAPTIDWYFDSLSDVRRAHDSLTDLYNAQEADRRALYNMKEAERRKEEDKRRAKIDEKRKEYEFEDGEYIIRLPKNILEIIEEGSKQRICIGGYTTRHANGETNLFFLRKKSEDDKPFYAIEMDKYKNIVQIHGYCNKWLGNNPEAIPTVIRWLRKHNIKCADTILTCNSVGYSRSSTHVEMPTVDGKKGV
jgi:hypothetical protein